MSKPIVKSAKARNGHGAVQLPTFRHDVFITLKGKAKQVDIAPRRKREDTLLASARRALERPGLSARSVFTKSGVRSYSIDPKDPTRIIRETASGSKARGRLVGGQFRAVSGK